MQPVEIPTLLFWENGNTWYGSKGNARFFIQPISLPSPEGEEHVSSPMLQIELWRGPLMKELSEILTTVTFPMTDNGIQQTIDWLEEQAVLFNS